ncbi:MAG: primosomal protein N' [Lachnospiraceae bacterium]|nr:primosomal protein N' [Lachnospiraceae bacterium]
MSRIYADIIVDISNEALDKTFQYIVPEALQGQVEVGSYVQVPFGRGNRLISGFVLALSSQPKIAEDKLKELSAVLKDNSLVEGKLIQLSEYMRSRYGTTMIQALKTVFPVKKQTRNKEEKTIRLLLSKEEAERQLMEFREKHRTARERLLSALLENGAVDYRLVTGKLGVSRATIDKMEELGILSVSAERVFRGQEPFALSASTPSLNEEQKAIASEIIADYERGLRRTYLIRGVTGSGKTEIYMEIIDHVVRSGRQVIVLIPEIALTFQTLMRFYRRFGDQVSTLHSRLSEGERYDQFERAKKGELSIMIGPRSALFTPFERLGLIVIDEEHETSYKSELSPKYHAREVAEKLAGLHGASLILGSATPSVDSYYKAMRGAYRLFTIDKRAKKDAVLAETQIVDLREEFHTGNRSIFSRALQKEIGERLRRGEQTMLFLNRRGFAGFVSCRTCGHVIKCPHCDISLSSHRNGRLVCHYCGYEQEAVKRCPSCSSEAIGGMRAGTEQIEEQIKKLFPFAQVLRMDRDTTKKKDDYERILSAFANHEADILIGTQMIVKGHDFPEVTLVGILAADMSLYTNDYRSGERTFDLLTQAAGRAGRGERKGLVIIQTYNPEHYSIEAAKRQDYEYFYGEEIAYRKLLDYPPAGHLLVILCEGKNEKQTGEMTADLAELANDVIIERYGDQGLQLIGPADATIGKLNDIYRKLLYIKGKNETALTELSAFLMEQARKKRTDGGLRGGEVYISFDLDPIQGY